MNQTDFAALGGVGRKSQFNYEDDERTPDADYLAAIAQAGADIRYIVTGEREGPPPLTLSQDEQELLALFRAAPLAVKAAAIGALQGGAGVAQAKVKKQINVSASASGSQAAGRKIVNKGKQD